MKQRKTVIALVLALVLAMFAGLIPNLGSAQGTETGTNTPQQSAAEDESSVSGGTTAEAASGNAVGTDGAQPAAEPAGDGAEAKPDAQLVVKPEVKLYPITATKQIAENERFRLYIDEKSGNVRVVDKRTNREWLGEPQADRTTLPNNKKFMDSPVHIRYTNGVDVTQTYTLKDKDNKLAIQSIEDGVRESFTLTQQGISFAIEIRLTSDGLKVTIPYDFIRESGSSHLVSLEPLPFFNAATEQDQGALFVPDGSGALIAYRPNHPKYLAGYSQPVYGPDYTYLVQFNDKIDQVWQHAMPPREYVALPVFGNYKNGIGFLGIATKGETDALINGTPSGIRNIPMYRASVEFVYRKNDVIFIGSSGDIPLYQGELVKGDREVRYVLLQGDDAGYVGMAKAYRKYLTDEAGVKPVAREAMPLNVTLYGGVLRDEVIGTTFIAMTTFAQAKSVIDAYGGKGVTNLQLTLEGWSKDGEFGNQPDHFPADSHLGGYADLKDLADYAKSKGVALYLKANYVRPYVDSDGFDKKADATRGLDRSVMKSYNYWVSNGYNNRSEIFYYLKPDHAYDKYIAREIEEYRKLGVAGVDLQYMGDTLYSDQDLKHLFSRQQTVDVWVKALDAFRQNVGKTAVDYGFAYTLGHVDRIDNAPTDDSGFIMTDSAVPFYEIALHGLVPYAAKPSNLRDDSQADFLRALEYGAEPSYELSYEPTEKLQRTHEDRLFSSSFVYWLEPSVQEYKVFQSLQDTVGGEPIVNHEQLSRYLFRTTYGDGTQVVVNYGSTDADADGVQVKAHGYAIFKGGA
jgi:hypothetical protein